MLETLSEGLQNHFKNHLGYGPTPCQISMSSLALSAIIATKGDLEKASSIVMRCFNLLESPESMNTTFLVCTEEDARLICTSILEEMPLEIKDYLLYG